MLLLLLLINWLVLAGHWSDHLFTNVVLSFVSTSLPSRIRWLVARSIEAGIDAIALQRGYFKVHSSKFDNISNTHHLLLIVWEEVLQDLINGSFLTDDQPHRPVQVNIVLLVLVGLPLRLRLFIDSFDNVVSIHVRLLTEVGLIQKWFIVGPQATILVLHQEPKHDLIFPF